MVSVLYGYGLRHVADGKGDVDSLTRTDGYGEIIGDGRLETVRFRLDVISADGYVDELEVARFVRLGVLYHAGVHAFECDLTSGDDGSGRIFDRAKNGCGFKLGKAHAQG